VTSSRSANSLPDHTESWHTLKVEKSLELLQSSRETGLTSQQVSERLERYGTNEIEEMRGRNPWAIFFDQFKDTMLMMLIAVALVSAFFDLQSREFPKDTIAILLIVILNGVLGYLQESKAEKALAALKRLASPKVRILREGKVTDIAAKEVVPGDIMLLEPGVQIAADGRLISASNLHIRESALTGEADAVSKKVRGELPADSPLGDRINLVFQGTEVVQGRAQVLVTNTGMKTELGKIAAMIQEVEAEPTPLQRRMTQLGGALVTGSMILVALVVLAWIVQTGRWWDLREPLEVSLSMAVAVVPEGLPAVTTVTLALGTQRMVRRHALIRKLPAVETLGSVTHVCSDKTGTLTQNKMVVQVVNTPSHRFRVAGRGYAPVGEFYLDEGVVDPNNYQELQPLLAACVLCNDALLQREGRDWGILGDPTEGALLSLAGKAGIVQEEWAEQFPRYSEFSFSSERKRMSAICCYPELRVNSELGGNFSQDNLSVGMVLAKMVGQSISCLSPEGEASGYLVFTKGSPEIVLARCDRIQVEDRAEALTEAHQTEILQHNDQMAARGLRVLGFACRGLETLSPDVSDTEIEQNLIWLGLVGMLDAPRPEAREAVSRCLQAGIRPAMITGDHQLTAQAIARDLGIAQSEDRILNGPQLDKLDQVDLEQQVHQVNIYARVSPEHKLRIVKALQRQGKIVAMTGDGVNDAPALKQADIGIAMGITGTDVSKEASDMVLLDDNFATIVAATEEGRVVYTNIRRFIKYILGSNIGEVLTIAAAPLLGLDDIPLVPLQILWMNLVTDGLPALALAVEPAEPNVMRRPPHDPQESIFARGLGWYMLRIGVIFALLTILLMVWAHDYYEGDPKTWKTMVFTTLCLAQMGHALALRSNKRLTLELTPFSNLYIWAAVIVTTILQLMLVYVPPLRNFFETTWLSPGQLAICLGFSSLIFVWVELEKLFIRWYESR